MQKKKGKIFWKVNAIMVKLTNILKSLRQRYIKFCETIMSSNHLAWLNSQRYKCIRLQGITLEDLTEKISRGQVDLRNDRHHQTLKLFGDFIRFTKELIYKNQNQKNVIWSLNKENRSLKNKSKYQEMQNIELKNVNRDLDDFIKKQQTLLHEVSMAIGPEKINIMKENINLKKEIQNKQKQFDEQKQQKIQFKRRVSQLQQQLKEYQKWNKELINEILYYQVNEKQYPNQRINRPIPTYQDYIQNMRIRLIPEVNPISQMSIQPLASDFYHVFRNEERQNRRKSI